MHGGEGRRKKMLKRALAELHVHFKLCFNCGGMPAQARSSRGIFSTVGISSKKKYACGEQSLYSASLRSEKPKILISDGFGAVYRILTPRCTSTTRELMFTSRAFGKHRHRSSIEIMVREPSRGKARA